MIEALEMASRRGWTTSAIVRKENGMAMPEVSSGRVRVKGKTAVVSILRVTKESWRIGGVSMAGKIAVVS